MRNLEVYIECNGNMINVGSITGHNSDDAVFSYSEEYIEDKSSRAISISLPLDERSFSPERTRCFFESLLPEGYTRRCVAGWLHVDENDYISVLSELGSECLGAIRIVEGDMNITESSYRLLSHEELLEFAREGATKSAELVIKSHLSLAGASGKTGLYYDRNNNEWYQPAGLAPSTHILKQSHVRLKKIVANEQLCLLTARKLGIRTPDSFIINRNDKEDDFLFATERYDRKILDTSKELMGKKVPLRLHQEDFAQALGITASQKYEKNGKDYLADAFELIKNYSSNPIEDQIRLWDLCIFNYLIGNTDNHVKNIALLYSEDLKGIRLAPAYDLLSTVIYDSSTEKMSLNIDGEYDIRNINQKSFENEAKKLGLGKGIATQHFLSMVEKFEMALEQSTYELEEQGYGVAVDIHKQILKKAGIHNFKLTNS